MEETNTSTQQAIETPTNEETKTEEIKPANWLEEESKNLSEPMGDFEKLPSFQFEENKIVMFKVDFSKPFESWDDTINKVKKKIIPVYQGEERKNLWLNVKNPLYSDIVKKGLEGQTEFKVLQTGNKSTTKYTIVEE